jgi:hypothetical protein
MQSKREQLFVSGCRRLAVGRDRHFHEPTWTGAIT